MEKKEFYIKLAKELSDKLNDSSVGQSALTEVYCRILTLVENLYGKNDFRIDILVKFKSEKFDGSPSSDFARINFKSCLKGVADGIVADIENDLIYNLEKQTVGSVVADFITLAKTSAEENNKDVAAVLASAALEDSLKRFAILNGLQVDEKEMSEVVNALKANSLLKGPQASVVSSYVKTRNKAFHAEFDKIEMPEVKSLIAFTEEFIIKNLS